MGLHPSLKRAESLTSQRSVLKRTERIKLLLTKGEWKEGDSVLKLPKIKIVRLKTSKREKPKEAEEKKAEK